MAQADPKTGESTEENRMPFTHLCLTSDCLCEDDLLWGIRPASGPMVNRVPDWFLDAMRSHDLAIKKPSAGGAPKPMANAWVDKVDQADNPNTYAFLTDTKYDDGSPRMTGSISIFTQIGVLKACIADKDNKRVAFIEAPSLCELFGLIEMAICDESTDWKAQQQRPPY